MARVRIICGIAGNELSIKCCCRDGSNFGVGNPKQSHARCSPFYFRPWFCCFLVVTFFFFWLTKATVVSVFSSSSSFFFYWSSRWLTGGDVRHVPVVEKTKPETTKWEKRKEKKPTRTTMAAAAISRRPTRFPIFVFNLILSFSSFSHRWFAVVADTRVAFRSDVTQSLAISRCACVFVSFFSYLLFAISLTFNAGFAVLLGFAQFDPWLHRLTRLWPVMPSFV